MTSKRFLVTAALPYSNGPLHVGHIAGAYLPADIFVRYLRCRGIPVRFVCGSDDHGVAALVGAAREGKSVEEFTAFYHDRQAEDFAALGIHFDIFGGTHQASCAALHRQISQNIFTTIHDNNFFVKRTTAQLYDVAASRFLPDRYVTGTCYHPLPNGQPCGSPASGDQCESCGNLIDPAKLINPVSILTGNTPELRQTTHWCFQLSRFEPQLRDWLTSKREEWRDAPLNYALTQIDQGLPERPMTRDLEWGIPVPLNDPDAAGKVLYVWFEAPVGYVSFTAQLCQNLDGDWRQYELWWKSPDSTIVHFIGQDNTIFHTLTWPAMILAEGSLRLPSHVVVNAFLKVRPPDSSTPEKASKSRGTAVWITDCLRVFDPDTVRYYLNAIAPESGPATFDLKELIQRHNTDLVNTLGNFCFRCI